MKKKVIAAIMVALMLCFNFSVYTANAATCPPHSNYVDRVDSVSGWNTTHNVNTGLYIDGHPIYEICTVLHEGITHGIYCGVCSLRVGYYNEEHQHHSHWICQS